MESSKVVRRDSLAKPDAVCLRCFNSQQQLRFPFLVYCEHRQTLALFVSAHESTTFPCAPAQLEGLIARLGARHPVAQPGRAVDVDAERLQQPRSTEAAPSAVTTHTLSN